MLYLLLLLGVNLLPGLRQASVAATEPRPGILIVAADSTLTTDSGYSYTPGSDYRYSYNSAGAVDRFVTNLGRYFAGNKKAGKFLILSKRDVFGKEFESSLTRAGHTVTRSLDARNLNDYDGVFVAGDEDGIDREKLAAYIRGGGRVYLVALTSDSGDEEFFWKIFLSDFDIEVTPFREHSPVQARSFPRNALFDGVGSLYISKLSNLQVVRKPGRPARNVQLVGSVTRLMEKPYAFAIYSTQEPPRVRGTVSPPINRREER